MANKIVLNKRRLEQEKLTAEQLIDKLEGMLPQVKGLSFGCDGSKRSTGPCADAMEELTTEMAAAMEQMAATMRSFIGFIHQGAENITKMDEALARETEVPGGRHEREAAPWTKKQTEE